MDCFVQETRGGRMPVPEDIRVEIRAHVMQDRYTKVLPDRHGGAESRAFVVDVREVYDAFPLKEHIEYNAFRLLVSGKKASAVGADGDMPKIRSWVHITDKCQVCPQRQGSVAVVQQFVTQAVKNTGNTGLQEAFETLLDISCQADPYAGRAEVTEMD